MGTLKEYYEKNYMGFYPVSVYYRASENGNVLIHENEKGINGFIFYYCGRDCDFWHWSL